MPLPRPIRNQPIPNRHIRILRQPKLARQHLLIDTRLTPLHLKELPLRVARDLARLNADGNQRHGTWIAARDSVAEVFGGPGDAGRGGAEGEDGAEARIGCTGFEFDVRNGEDVGGGGGPDDEVGGHGLILRVYAGRTGVIALKVSSAGGR